MSWLFMDSAVIMKEIMIWLFKDPINSGLAMPNQTLQNSVKAKKIKMSQMSFFSKSY